MAPTVPKARTHTHLPKSARPSQAQPSYSFGLDRTSKRDKRIIKRSTLLSRIKNVHASPHKKRRRRPSKKLVTNLEGLADALPESESGGWKNRAEDTIQQKSLKSKPGSAKKREREITEQKLRFERNLTRLIDGKNTDGSAMNTDREEKEKIGNSWQKLRAFIQQTMEKK